MSTHVLIDGVVSLYQDKAPFLTSGKSIQGALEYDPTTDTVKCHDCGDWKGHLASHLIRKHGYPTVRDYKLRHGLKIGTALISEGTRAKLVVRLNNGAQNLINYHKLTDARIKLMVRMRTIRKSGIRKRKHFEKRNSRNHCDAQLIETIKRAGKQIGTTPTGKQLREFGLNPSILGFRFGGIKQAMRLAGFIPNKARSERQFSTKQLIESMKSFVNRFGRSPSYSDAKRGLLICKPDTFIRRFGSWNKAVSKSGAKPRPQGRAIVSKHGTLIECVPMKSKTTIWRHTR